MLKILSRQLDLNPQPFQRSNEAFHQFNQKHNKKLMKTLTTLLNLVIICQKKFNQKLKCQIRIFKLY
jgi:hypothetical protein